VIAACTGLSGRIPMSWDWPRLGRECVMPSINVSHRDGACAMGCPIAWVVVTCHSRDIGSIT